MVASEPARSHVQMNSGAPGLGTQPSPASPAQQVDDLTGPGMGG